MIFLLLRLEIVVLAACGGVFIHVVYAFVVITDQNTKQTVLVNEISNDADDNINYLLGFGAFQFKRLIWNRFFTVIYLAKRHT